MQVVFIHGAGIIPDRARGQDYPLLARLLSLCPDLRVPVMPDAMEPTLAGWMRGIDAALSPLDPDSVLIGHSHGGAMILKWVAEHSPGFRARNFLGLAAPFWRDYGFDLPDGFARSLTGIARLTFCAATDDEIIKPSDLDAYVAAVPRSDRVLLNSGGHMLDCEAVVPVLERALRRGA
ncbi:hypothetical protein [Brevundimonas sp.]|uniref:hypothetical protein n=1 Tax=Brevundimonas sp. TaxID=1871086 RepID=UPI00286A4DC6|nr:hypothetical protein [Brevundimonas sp.]